MLRRPSPGPPHTGVCAHVARTPTFQLQLELLQQHLGWDDGAWGALGARRPWGPWQAELKGNLGHEDIEMGRLGTMGPCPASSCH